MIVDASAFVELLLGSRRGRRVAAILAETPEDLRAPGHVDLEVLATLRRFLRSGDLTEERAAEAVADWNDLDLERVEPALLAPRVWELRNNQSPYDAAYVALAEAFDEALLTCDARLARAPGHGAKLRVVEGGETDPPPPPHGLPS
jgi:predicted nucleic acid-binding protein